MYFTRKRTVKKAAAIKRFEYLPLGSAFKLKENNTKD